MIRLRSTLLATGLTVLALAAGRVAANDNTWTAGMNLTWNVTSSNWTSPAIWNNANVDSAIFGSTGVATLSVGAPISLFAMQFTANGYTLNGSNALTFQNGSDPLLEPGEIQVLSGVTTTINAPIGGTIGLDKTFPGTLVLGGTNTFTGTTLLDGGTLKITGTMTNATAMSNGATLQFAQSGGATLSNAYTGKGTLSLLGTSGATVFTLNSTSNTYTGGTLVQSSTLQVGATNALPTGGLVTLGSGTNPGVLRLGGFNQTIRGLVSSGTGANGVTNFGISGTNTLTINVPTGFGYTFTGRLGGSGTDDNNFGLIVAGGGTQYLTNGSNSYNGATTINNAYLSVSDVGALGSAQLQFLGGLLSGSTTEAQSTWIYTGPTVSTARQTILNGSGAIQVATTGTTLTMIGVISQGGGASGVTVFGDGSGGSTLVLSAANTYTGPTVVDAGGVLSIATVANGGVASPIGAASNSATNLQLGGLFGGGTLLYTGPTASTDRGANLYSASSNATINVATAGTALTMSGPFTGAGGLTKAGTGTLILGGANTFTGSATVSSGTLEITGTMNSNNATIAAGATLLFVQSGTQILSGAYSGSGTLAMSETVSGTSFVLTSTSNSYTGSTLVQHGTLQLGASGVIPDSSVVVLGSGTQPGVLRLAGFDETIGGLQSSGSAVSQVTNFGGSGTNTLTINAPATSSYTFAGLLGGSGGGIDTNFALVVAGGGTVLTNNGNNYTGGTTVQAGALQVAGDGCLGASSAPVTVGAAGTLTFTSSTATIRTFNLSTGTLAVPTGVTLTLNGASIFGGFLRGAGALTVTGGTALTGVTTFGSTVISQTGAGSYTNFTNGSPLTIAAGLTGPIPMSGFSNEGSGSITIGAGTPVSAADFQTYGTLTINPATVTENFSQTTLLTNVGASPLFFNGGSRTFIGTPATAVFPSSSPQKGQPTFVAGIDLHGQNAVVAGGLLVNNGYVEDSTNNFAGTATIIADFGSLVKGAGYFQNSVQTINGGKFQAGNSPGSASFGKFVFGPGGVNNYVFAIDDATGTAGPSPDAASHVSGWGLVKAISHLTATVATPGDFTWTATPADKLTLSLQTLVNPTTVGNDVPGLMDHFDPNLPYSWPAVEWSGSYAGPASAAMLDSATAFDTGGFANPVAGTFGWSLDAADDTLSLTYSPSAVPEPGTFTLVGFAAVALAWRRRGLQRKGSHAGADAHAHQ